MSLSKLVGFAAMAGKEEAVSAVFRYPPDDSVGAKEGAGARFSSEADFASEDCFARSDCEIPSSELFERVDAPEFWLGLSCAGDAGVEGGLLDFVYPPELWEGLGEGLDFGAGLGEGVDFV
jgi:hypothetical protein